MGFQPKKGFHSLRHSTFNEFLTLFFSFSRASDRGDSPWCSSLNHSYETLNMPDSASDNDPSASTPLKNPHR